MRFLVLQHATCEPPAAYQDVLEERGIDVHAVELDQGDPLPPWKEFDALIAMGGPMSANEEDTFGWLRDEKRLIREAVEVGRPFWGVCLGAQLLAASLGAQVHPGPAPEVGILRVILEKEGISDRVFSSLPHEFSTLQWHSDTFDLPHGASLLASSPAYRHQAFRWGRAYGLQFHLEVSPELAEQWGDIPAYADALESVLGQGALSRVVEELREEAGPMRSHAQALFLNWLDLVVSPPKEAPR